jgi:hypothetical protein
MLAERAEQLDIHVYSAMNTHATCNNGRIMEGCFLYSLPQGYVMRLEPSCARVGH